MFKQLVIVIIILFVGKTVFAQSQKWNKFIPVDFTILDTASGDINKDGLSDLVLILRSKEEKSSPDTIRPLLLLEGIPSGGYKLAARNDSVVLCLDCGGVMGDPYQGITIKNGYFSIEHYGGSSLRWTRVITFKYDQKLNQYILHRDAGSSWRVSNPNKQTESLYGKEDFDKLNFMKYSYDRSW